MNELSQELAKEYASREFILAQTDIDEHLNFIRSQIKDPFNNGSVNHFRKMIRMIPESAKAKKREYATRVLELIANEYPNLDIDMEQAEDNLLNYSESLYKFFAKNLKKLVTAFLREYLFNNKNRKALLSTYQDIKIATYPKEQFGKKEHYILIIKLPSIVRDIMSLPIDVDQFIQFCIRNNDKPQYIDDIETMLTTDILIDYGIYSDIMDKFEKSDTFDGVINKLQTRLIEAIVRPCVEDMGYSSYADIVELEDDEITDEDEENPDDPKDVDDTPMRIDDFEGDF